MLRESGICRCPNSMRWGFCRQAWTRLNNTRLPSTRRCHKDLSRRPTPAHANLTVCESLVEALLQRMLCAELHDSQHSVKQVPQVRLLLPITSTVSKQESHADDEQRWLGCLDNKAALVPRVLKLFPLACERVCFRNGGSRLSDMTRTVFVRWLDLQARSISSASRTTNF